MSGFYLHLKRNNQYELQIRYAIFNPQYLGGGIPHRTIALGSSKREIPFLKGYRVFNAEQCEGLPAQYTASHAQRAADYLHGTLYKATRSNEERDAAYSAVRMTAVWMIWFSPGLSGCG